MSSLLAAALLATTVITTPESGLAPLSIVAHHGAIYQTDKAGDPTQAFMEIDNTGGPDALVEASCPIADTTSIVGPDGKPLANLAIPAGQNVTLRANGPHLLLQATHFSVQYGGIIPCSLTFTKAGTMSIFLYAEKGP
jgi:copper(I)-binding protein